MRRLYAALMIAAVAVLLFAAHVSAEPRYIPHEDPSVAEGSIDTHSLLLYYADVLKRIDQGDYAAVADMLDELQYANLPEEHRQLLDKYGGIIIGLPEIIQASSLALDDASSLIAEYRLSEADEKLYEVSVLIDEIEMLLSDIDEDTDLIGDALGVFESLPGSLLRAAYDALEDSVLLIWDIKAEMAELQAILDAEIAAILAKELKPTSLTLALSPASAFVGDAITVSGTLTSEEHGLNNKDISILIDGSAAAAAATDYDGDFQAQLNIPYEYVSPMSVRAFYTPSGLDLDRYLPSSSQIASLAVSFYRAEVELEAPNDIHPGLSFTIRGSVSWEQSDALQSRAVDIYLDDVLLAALAAVDGPFEEEVAIDLGWPLGDHTVRAVMAPDGRYAGASSERPIRIATVSPQLDIDVPALVVLPNDIHISGRVSSELPLEGGAVSIGLGSKSVEVEIQDSGEFSATLNMGLEWELIGLHDLTVRVSPVEPWHGTAVTKVKIFMLNAVHLSAIALCIVTGVVIGTMTYVRRKNRTKLERLIAPVAQAAPGEVISTIPSAKPPIVLEGNKGRVLKAYAAAVRAIEREAAIVMEPYMTMREFSAAAGPELHAAGEGFSKLTIMSEKALYSPHEIEDAEASAAEDAATAIMEAMRCGTA